MDMLDELEKYPDNNVAEEADKRFQEHYLHPLGDNVRYVLLQSEFKVICQSHNLISFRNAHER